MRSSTQASADGLQSNQGQAEKATCTVGVRERVHRGLGINGKGPACGEVDATDHRVRGCGVSANFEVDLKKLDSLLIVMVALPVFTCKKFGLRKSGLSITGTVLRALLSTSTSLKSLFHVEHGRGSKLEVKRKTFVC